MLNAELHRLCRPQLPKIRSFSWWMWYKCIFTNGYTNLDFCGKFDIDVSHRCIVQRMLAALGTIVIPILM